MAEQNFEENEKHNPVQQLQEKPKEFLIVGIGASAGGIQALQEFFKNVKPDSGMAYVVILHLSPDHDSLLAEILQREIKIPVAQVMQRVQIQPNHIYVVPPNQHLTMEDSFIAVTENTVIEERRAPVDIFFRTLADEHGPRAVAVILSGTGANGSMGLKRVKERGGACFVQNPREAEFDEMPRNSIATGMVDEVLSVSKIPETILNFKANLGSVEITEDIEKRPEDQQQALREIFTQLRLRTGHDFSNYKRPTLLRRIERRINIRNLPDLPAYTKFFLDNPNEPPALLKDLLISVTNFFRDKKPFEMIEYEILPIIFNDKTGEDQVRIWVAGCATGEEAYSIAMLCMEKVMGLIDAPKVQIFATDIDENAIAVARDGLYTLNDVADVSPERLRRFFTKEEDNYRVRREIRETVLFATHNFLKDPPFSHLDLVTCRNVMIYLNNVAQERVIETFHFALNPAAYLFLGTSESIDGATDLYAVYNRENHIFQSRPVTAKTYPIPETVPSLYIDKRRKEIQSQPPEIKIPERITYGDLHQQLLEEYAPPSVVINEEYNVLHLTERAGKYLQVAGGEPSQNLLKLIKPELRLELRSALYQAVQRQTPIQATGLKVRVDKETEIINIHIRPVLRTGDTAKGFLLVLFEPAVDDGQQQIVLSSDEPVAKQLEEELVRVKAQLRAANEQHDFQAEEMKASNEEWQAMNEELRSAAEELETSKEELQSMNEEMRTVNQELKVKIEETSIANNNLQNLVKSTEIGTIFLDRSLRVVLFTPSVRDIFNLIPADYGRSLSDITGNLEYTELLHDAEMVLEKLKVIEKEVSTKNGVTYLMRITPYRTDEDRIKGVVITFLDVNIRKQASEIMRKSEERLQRMVNVPQVGVLTFNYDGLLLHANDAFLEMLNYTREEFKVKQFSWRDFTPPEYVDASITVLKQLKETGRGGPYEKEYYAKDGSKVWIMFVAADLNDGTFVEYAIDVSARKKIEEALHKSEERLQLAAEAARIGTFVYYPKEDRGEPDAQMLKLFGLPADGTLNLNKALTEIIHTDDRERYATEVGEAFDPNGTGRLDSEIRIVHSDGSVHWMAVTAQTKFEGNPPQAASLSGVAVDITARKKLEQQKEDFIGIASHELKTPVTSIKAYAEVLHEIFDESKDAASAEMMKKLDIQIDRLIDLIRALLDTSKLAEGELMLSPSTFDLCNLVEERIQDLQRLSSSHPIITQKPKETIITADRERIGQVLTNLISNAIKYSPQGGDVIIEWKEVNGDVQVSVRDKGMGISEEAQKQVFDRFFRVKSEQMKNYAGMGLGLFITAYIVKKHGGDIWVGSEPGKGSTFYFTLPLKSDK